MKKGLVSISVIVTSLALIGVVVTQIIWVHHAIRLRTQQFEYSVYNSLYTVVDKIEDIKRDSIFHTELLQQNDTSIHITDIKLDYKYLVDSLLKESFGCLKINEDYNWAMIDTIDQRFVFGEYDDAHKDGVLKSCHAYPVKNVIDGHASYYLKIYFPAQKHLILRKMLLWLLVLSGVFLLVVVVTFMLFIYTILRQKKLSEMKNDFINNMTHEFKTPISTISVASEILMKPSVNESPEKTLRYANIIFDENLRLRNQVEQVLHISVLDKDEFKLKMTKIDIHKIIENSIDTFNVILRERKGKLLADLYATKSEVVADEVHIINLISNLLDNAIKYSVGTPEIKILTRDALHGIEILISDKGAGMNSEDLKHIFKKFYRVHTGDRHDVKGFGLGLFYVKTVVDAHHGRIKVNSELKKGSTFEIYLPYNSRTESHD